MFFGNVIIIALEIFHTHATTMEKITETRAAGICIAEFSAKEVNDMKPGHRLNNLQVTQKMCSACDVKDTISKQFVAIQQEHDEVLRQELAIVRGYHIMSGNPKLDKTFSFKSLKERALLILDFFAENMKISHPRFNDIHLGKHWRFKDGIKIETKLPAPHCIVLILDAIELEQPNFILSQIANAQKDRVPKEFVFMVHARTILNSISHLERSRLNGIKYSFKDCSWPILKTLERNLHICASCCKTGHSSESCTRKICRRCGFLGHKYTSCFAKRNAAGMTLM